MVGAPGVKRSHVERRINEPEAAVVRRIFELCQAGIGPGSGAITPSCTLRLTAVRQAARRMGENLSTDRGGAEIFGMRASFIITLWILTNLSVTQREYNPATLLEITSPASGAIVEPGQRVAITVNSATVREAEYAVISPLGMSNLVSQVPGRAFIDIKKDQKAGRHPLTAMGNTRAGQPVVSNTIEIDVERSDTPLELSEINHMRFVELTERGGGMPMLLLATFADGTVLDVQESSHMTYTSSDPKVASVSAYGMISAVGIGETTIRAEYRNGSAVRWFEVPVDVPALILTVTPGALDFGPQPIGTTSAPRTLLLKNADTEPMRITAVHAIGEEYAVSGPCVGSAPLPVNGTCTLNVTFTPSAVGPRPWIVGVETDRTLLPDPVHVTGVGMPR